MTDEWRGRFLEDFEVGAVYRSWLGRTVTEADNVWFTNLTMNTNQIHFNSVWAAQTEFTRPLVNSTLTLALVVGLSVRDTSENAIANLGWGEIKLPRPVFVGDTLWAVSQVEEVRESKSRANCGIVRIRTTGVNQADVAVIEFTRSFLILKRDAATAQTAG
jgi:itaconyl-CoA hydratase